MKKLYLIWTLLGLLFAPFAWAQNNVTGTVNDETGTPLHGATVIVDGTNRGVVTDFDGNFSIDAEQGEVLVITYIGYADLRLTIGSQADISAAYLEGIKSSFAELGLSDSDYST